MAEPVKADEIHPLVKVVYPDATKQTTKVEVHGADKHTNVTRELFLPPDQYTTGTVTREPQHNIFPVVELVDALSKAAYFVFKVPDDFVSFVKLETVWFAQPAAGNMWWGMTCYYGASGEAFDTHSDPGADGATATGGAWVINVQEPADSPTLPDLAIGDYVGLSVGRVGDNVNDTLNASVYLVGLLFTYVAEQ